MCCASLGDILGPGKAKLTDSREALATRRIWYQTELHTLTDLRGDQRGDFLEILPDFRRGDQERDRLNITQCLNMT